MSILSIISAFVVSAQYTTGSVTVGTGYFVGRYTSFDSGSSPSNASGWTQLTPATAVSVSAATNRIAGSSIYGRVTASYMGTQYLNKTDITQHVYSGGKVIRAYWLNQPTTVYA